MVTGCSLNKVLLQGHWLVSMVGFKLCFFPMHVLGMRGLPRRVCNYDAGYYWIHNLCRLGSFMSVVSGFVLFYILWESLYVRNVVIGVVGASRRRVEVFGTYPVGYHSLYGYGVSYFRLK